MASKPASYVNWCPNNTPQQIQEPPASEKLSGFVPGEAPPAQYFNWLFKRLDDWVQFLAEGVNQAGGAASTVQATARLLGGGAWTWNGSTGVVTWSAPMYLAIVSEPDANNTIAAGSATLADGQIAYVQANLPFSTTGNLTAGSNQLTSLAFTSGIAVGQGVSGTGVAPGTTVQSIAGSTVTLSQNATATGGPVSVTFAGSGPLVVKVDNSATVVPTAQTFVLARRIGDLLVTGINGGYVLRDREQKTLRGSGYVQTFSAPAGAALSLGTPVYISPGGTSDNGRTAGSYYPCEAAATTGVVRANMIGVVITSVAQGQSATVVCAGWAPLYTGLVPGTPYYLDPQNPGSLTATKPVAGGQYTLMVGIAVSSTILMVNESGATPQVVQSGATRGNYGVANETQLAAAIAACSAAGGGVICLTGSFSISAAYTLPPYTIVLGARSQSVITLLAGSVLTVGSYATLQDTHFTTAVSSGGYCVNLSGTAGIIRGCRWVVPAANNIICLYVNGTGNRTYNNKFETVAGSATASGIVYGGGSDNVDNSSVFT